MNFLFPPLFADPFFGVFGEDARDALPCHERAGERDLGFFDRSAAFEAEKRDVPALVVRLAECSAQSLVPDSFTSMRRSRIVNDDIGVVPIFSGFDAVPLFQLLADVPRRICQLAAFLLGKGFVLVDGDVDGRSRLPEGERCNRQQRNRDESPGCHRIHGPTLARNARERASRSLKRGQSTPSQSSNGSTSAV